MPMKSKTMSEKAAAFAKGGGNKMASKSQAAPVIAGQVSTGGRTAGDKIGGGSGHMAKQSGAAPVIAGQVSSGGRSGDNTFKVSGGKGHMAGFTGSTAAKPR